VVTPRLVGRHSGVHGPWARIKRRRRRRIMYLVRDIMYCKPGKVRPLLAKFKDLARLTEKMGMGRMRLMTDVSAEQFWTLASEFEVPSLKMLEDMDSMQGSPEDMKEFERIMSGYHDLVDRGRREIYKIEL
jgi:hypothetical protein